MAICRQFFTEYYPFPILSVNKQKITLINVLVPVFSRRTFLVPHELLQLNQKHVIRSKHTVMRSKDPEFSLQPVLFGVLTELSVISV